MNTQNLRLQTKNDILPTLLFDQCFGKWFEENNGKRECIYGSIGKGGTKVHRFVAWYINLNGENVIIDISSRCGSQIYNANYRSGLGVNLNYTEEQVTCQKCKPKK